MEISKIQSAHGALTWIRADLDWALLHKELQLTCVLHWLGVDLSWIGLGKEVLNCI